MKPIVPRISVKLYTRYNLNSFLMQIKPSLCILCIVFVLWAVRNFSFRTCLVRLDSIQLYTKILTKTIYWIMLCFKKVQFFQIVLFLVALILTYQNIENRFFSNEVLTKYDLKGTASSPEP